MRKTKKVEKLEFDSFKVMAALVGLGCGMCAMFMITTMPEYKAFAHLSLSGSTEVNSALLFFISFALGLTIGKLDTLIETITHFPAMAILGALFWAGIEFCFYEGLVSAICGFAFVLLGLGVAIWLFRNSENVSE